MKEFDTIVQYAWDLLESGIQHPQWPIRFAAAEALADLGDTRAIDVLEEGVAAEESFIRYRAVLGLGKLIASTAASYFCSALEDEDPVIRGQAIIELARCSPTDACENIMAGLNDKNDFVKEKTIIALSFLEKEFAEPILEAIATGQQNYLYPIRLLAAFHLATKQNATGIRVLYEALNCEDTWVAFLAATRLADLGDSRGIPQLRYVLSQGEWKEKLMALEALLKLGDSEESEEAIYRPSTLPDPSIQIEAVRILAQFSSDFALEDAYDIIATHLENPDEAICIRAIEVIGEIGKMELADLLEDILIDSPEHIRATAVMAIEKLASSHLLPYLVPVLEKSHWLLRLQTARVAVKISS